MNEDKRPGKVTVIGASQIVIEPAMNRKMRRARQYGHVLRPSKHRSGYAQRVRRDGD